LARQTGPVCRLCRREGMKLFLKGERCVSNKCAFDKRNYAPGAQGKRVQYRQSQSDYAEQLREKQRARRLYGVYERQFRRYYDMALAMRGQTGANLLGLLERRFDNIVYRLGLAESRAQARQLIGHGHLERNGKRLDIPSALVEAGDVIRVAERSRNNGYFRDVRELMEGRPVPSWLSLNAEELGGTVLSLPTREQIEVPLQEQLIVEFYSR
jgi:small subunit ribosomal protein S4